MNVSERISAMTRLQVLGALLVLLLSAAWLLFSMRRSSDLLFIVNDERAVWITMPGPVTLKTFIAVPGKEPTATFTRHFRHEGPEPTANVHVQAFGDVTLELNGRMVPLRRGQRACFKAPCRASVSQLLVAGENSIRARVSNATGPALLSLRIDGPRFALSTDERWEVSIDDGPAEPAVRADDTRPYQAAREATTPMAALRERAFALLALFVLCSALFAAGRRFLPQAAIRCLPEIVLVLLSVFWVYLFVAKFVHIPVEVGYDANQHRRYVFYILRNWSLPLGTQGFSMYHPPLFYVAAAVLAWLVSALGGNPGAPWVVKLLPFVSGLGIVWVTYALARRVFDRGEPATLFAVVFAGVLPLNVYMSAYVSNEPAHALLAGLALLATARVLWQREPSVGAYGLLAGVLGLTILTKFTGLAVVAIVVFFVAFKMFVADGAQPRRVATVTGGVLFGVALIGGWFYVRNWVLLGDPLYWNLDHPSGIKYWQLPGFHTAPYYLGFGESLRSPYFSGLRSFWDGMYSGIWGEGLPPTVSFLQDRHALWNYDLMSAGYVLALPATAIVLFGVARTVMATLSGYDLPRRLLLSLLLALIYVISSSVLVFSMRYPFWGSIRAGYGLSLVAPVAVCAGFGFSAIDERLRVGDWRIVRALFHGWFGTFAVALALSFAS